MKSNVPTFPVVLGLSAAILALCAVPAHADIVGGDEVQSPDPIAHSTAALYEPSPDGHGGALCTASLISNDTAVTAAHCIDPHGIKPVLIFGRDVRAPESEKRQVSNAVVNAKWTAHQGRGMDQGDIAMVRFPGGLPPGYQPAPMIPSAASIRKGEEAVLAGYGITDARTRAGAGVLRKTRVRVEQDRPGKTEMILDQSHGHGACHGDSGGPAYVRVGGRPVLAGVTNRSYPDSGPDNCAGRVVYTKISAYRPWMKKADARLHSRSDSDSSVLKARVRPRAVSALRAIRQKAARQVRASASPRRRESHVRRSQRRFRHL
jgi:hypothetical protein